MSNPNNTDVYAWIGSSGGSWGSAANWDDVTTGASPASTAPGASDPVTFSGPTGSIYEVVGGGGNSASLAIVGYVDLSGGYATGAVAVGAAQTVGTSTSLTYTVGGLALSAGSTVSASSVLVADGTIAISGAGAGLSASGVVTLGSPDFYSSSLSGSASSFISGFGATGSLTVSGGAVLTAAGLNVVDGSVTLSGTGTSATISGALILGTPYSAASSSSAGTTSSQNQDPTSGTLTVSSGANLIFPRFGGHPC